jgi:hypothetical protein
MSINEPIDIDEVPVPVAVPVDRREEIVVTQQPGYEETEQVVHESTTLRRSGGLVSSRPNGPFGPY